MTCEDCEELNGPSTLENATHKITLLASPPTRALARVLPHGVKKALVTLLLTVTDVLRR